MASTVVGSWNSTVYKNATFRRSITLKEDDGTTPVDLTGCVVHLVVADKVDGDVLFDMSTDNVEDQIVIGDDPTLGAFEFYLTPEQTNGISVSGVIYSIDLIQVDEDVIPVLEGKWKIHERAASV